ncbi:SRPBCC family protein [Dongia deserti]|uniref:SRPBCC family protein n=1 Tax=Dongia deserti TaxID=2268030 RepID=UPI000E64F3F1|nr:SRPBCC family protein [Dongia deserti]
MSGRSATHGTFTLERVYDAAPARVFRAWSDVAIKARWFVGPADWHLIERAMDFRVGGKERLRGRKGSGVVSTFDSVYLDIVAGERIIYSYDMRLDDRHISVSLATVELKPEGAGTRLTITEQGVFLDGYDDAGSRERGTRILLDQLGAELRR